MVLYYIAYLYQTIKGYFYTTNNYKIPYDITQIKQDDDFKLFKTNNDINKVIFVLNNLPDISHKLLFKDNKNTANKYFHLTIKFNNDEFLESFHNLDSLEIYLNDANIRYIYIRVNIINIQDKIHHINCIIIDKHKKYVLLFEPKFQFSYDTDIVFQVLSKSVDFNVYKKLLPIDLGYGFHNKLQWFSLLCQSYAVFVFLLIVFNDDVPTEHYSKLFNTVITDKNVGYLLFHINKLLIDNDIKICEQDKLWSYPTHGVENIWNIMNFLTNKKEIEMNNIDDLNIKEDEGIIIVEKLL